MKSKISLIIVILLIPVFLWAEVSFVTEGDDNSYASVKDFTNTYEINLNKHNSKEISKCQAVRLAKNWFITAAHCVNKVCQDSSCSFQVRLMVGPNYEADITTTHGKQFGPKIFMFSKTRLDNRGVLYDIALVHFAPKDSKLVFRNPHYNTALSEKEFLNRIPNRSVYVRAVNGTNLPKILLMDTARPVMLERDLSIVSIWSGKRELLKNTSSQIFYSPKLSHFITNNFGVVRGISGSGVMTNTGELIGIVSAITEIKGKETVNLLYITPFDKEIMAFIKDHIPDISYIVADEDFTRPLTNEEQTFLKGIESGRVNVKQND